MSLARGREAFGSQAFTVSSPQSVPHQYSGVDTGPSSLDVWTATAKELEGHIKLEPAALERLLAP